jgi:hypothetical protein
LNGGQFGGGSDGALLAVFFLGLAFLCFILGILAAGCQFCDISSLIESPPFTLGVAAFVPGVKSHLTLDITRFG